MFLAGYLVVSLLAFKGMRGVLLGRPLHALELAQKTACLATNAAIFRMSPEQYAQASQWISINLLYMLRGGGAGSDTWRSGMCDLQSDVAGATVPWLPRRRSLREPWRLLRAFENENQRPTQSLKQTFIEIKK